MINENTNIYINREVSWIRFNERVLEEAESSINPIFERLNFCHIYNSNLDEFYMVRVGSLLDQTFLDKIIRDSKTNMTPKEQIDVINKMIHGLLKRKESAYFNNIKALENYRIYYVNIQHISPKLLDAFESYFDKYVKHLLSPQVIDMHHPFPFLENKKIYVGALLRFKSEMKLGIIPIESYIERLLLVPFENNLYFMTLEEAIYTFIHKLFTHKDITTRTIFRVTRNTDIDTSDDLSDQESDYIEFMQELLKKRRKLAAVRLECQYGQQPELLELLCENLHLTKKQLFVQDAPLDLSYIGELKKHLSAYPQLFYDQLTPQKIPTISDTTPLCTQILERDLLLHYPYHTMDYLIRLLNEAALDSEVTSIRITLYRMAKDSAVISALIKAAENGIDVGVVVELRARFDEYNNIEWAKKLEDAGCKVIYGLEGYKVHSKLFLITKKSDNDIQYITHIGTGNFNEKTAQFYTDIAFLTSKRSIGIEASLIFNSLFTGEFVTHTSALLVAPKCLRNKIIDYIDREIHYANENKPAEIFLKMNSLTDKLIINKLIEASKAGVKITMLIRGICCLRPGVYGETDHIRVYSIVGRFLEHSRIYIFGPKNRANIFISSADFMTRNTQKRVEVAVPIEDPHLKNQIFEWVNILYRDNIRARQLHSDGSYTHRLIEGSAFDAQLYLYKLAYKSAIHPNHTVHHPHHLNLQFKDLFSHLTSFLVHTSKTDKKDLSS